MSRAISSIARSEIRITGSRLSEVCLCVGVDFRAAQKRVDFPPVKLRMLRVGAQNGAGRETMLESNHDVMRVNAGLAREVVFVNVIENADKLGAFDRNAKFTQRNALQSFAYPLVLPNPAARNEPKPLSGPIDAPAKQHFAAVPPNEQIERHQRSCLNNFQKRLVVQVH